MTSPRRARAASTGSWSGRWLHDVRCYSDVTHRDARTLQALDLDRGDVTHVAEDLVGGGVSLRMRF